MALPIRVRTSSIKGEDLRHDDRKKRNPRHDIASSQRSDDEQSRSKTQDQLASQFRRRVVCEVEYPLMKNRPVLYVSYSEEILQDRRQSDKIITDLFRDAEDWKFMIIDHHGRINDRTDYQFWRVAFKTVQETCAAMYRFQTLLHTNSERVRGIEVTYTRPDGFQRRRTELFISGSKVDNKEELGQIFPETPEDIKRFSPDYDKDPQGDVRNLIWRVIFKDEEAARSAWMGLQHNPTSQHLYADYIPNPFTQGLIICFRTREFPRAVFENLSLYWEENYNKLVTEFEYATQAAELVDPRTQRKVVQYPGDIYYNIDDWEEPTQAYCRVITLNWWYEDLFYCLAYSGLAMLDLYSTAIFCSSLLSKEHNGLYAQELSYGTRVWFCVIFVVLLLNASWRCGVEAANDIHRIRNHAGDVLETKNYSNEIILFFALFVFYWVQIPGMVKDIVKNLHPWTNQQEKAAIKVNGARVFLIGFANEFQYRCDDHLNMHKQFPAVLLRSLVLTAFKAYTAFVCRSWTTFWLSLSGIALWPYQVYSFCKLLQDRKDYVRWLLKEATDNSLVDDLKEIKSQTPTQKGIEANWKKHFAEFNSLKDYSTVSDLTPPSFRTTLALIILISLVFLINDKLFGLHHHLRTSSRVSMHHAPAVPPSALGLSVAGLSAADANGDGYLSSWELQRAWAAGSFGDKNSKSAWTVRGLACALHQVDQPDAPLPTSCTEAETPAGTSSKAPARAAHPAVQTTSAQQGLHPDAVVYM